MLLKKILAVGILALSSFVLSSSAALAVPITVNFEGTVLVGTVGWGTAAVGDAVTGSFTIDSAFTDQIATDGAARWGAGANAAGMTATLTAGGQTANADSVNDTNGTFLQLYDDSPNDNVNVSVGALNLALLQLGGGTALQGLLDSNTVDSLATGLSILGGIDPADFTTSNLSTWIVTAGSEQIRFNLTSFTVVPEPSTAFLMGLGLLLAGYNRRR